MTDNRMFLLSRLLIRHLSVVVDASCQNRDQFHFSSSTYCIAVATQLEPASAGGRQVQV